MRSAGAMRLERRWTDFLTGKASRESDPIKPHFGTIEEQLMNLLHLPWLELAIAITLFGLLFVSRLRNPNRAYQWGLVFTGDRACLHAPGLVGVCDRGSPLKCFGAGVSSPPFSAARSWRPR